MLRDGRVPSPENSAASRATRLASTARFYTAMTGWMPSGSGVCWVAGLVLCLSAARASAAEMDWRAPASCPDAAELRFRVERALGMPLSHAAPLRFQVEVDRAARGYVAQVEVGPGQGSGAKQRVLAARDASGCL
jgi:hypothetical protein